MQSIPQENIPYHWPAVPHVYALMIGDIAERIHDREFFQLIAIGSLAFDIGDLKDALSTLETNPEDIIHAFEKFRKRGQII